MEIPAPERIANVNKLTKKMTNLFVTLLEGGKVPIPSSDPLQQEQELGDPMFSQKSSEFTSSITAAELVNCCEQLLDETTTLKRELMSHDFEHLSQSYQRKYREKEKGFSERLKEKMRGWDERITSSLKELENHYDNSKYHENNKEL